MKKLILTTSMLAVLAGSTFPGCSSQAPQGDIFSLPEVNEGATVVTVNGTAIHEGFLKVLADLSPRLKAQLDNPITRKKVLSSLVEQQMLYQEAIKRGLASESKVEVKALLNRHTIISNALLESELDAAMKKSYDERQSTQFTQIEFAQIVFTFITEAEAKKGVKPTEAQKQAALEKAKAAKSRLAKGEDFAALAKELSDDKRTSVKGGIAGKASKDDKRLARLQLQNLNEILFKLKKNEVSDPIETPIGYYIIKPVGDPEVLPFEEAKRVLGFELQASVKTKLLEDLKKNAVIEYANAKDAGKKPSSPAKPEEKSDNHTH